DRQARRVKRAVLRAWLVVAGLAGTAAAPPPSQDTLKLQVLLDRAHFSPGEIDGEEGTNTSRALAAFQQRHGLRPGGGPDSETWQALARDGAPALLSYVLTAADVAGPFVTIPEDMMEKARLEALSYTSPLEALAERF